jgi:hypothetical protein
VIHPKFGDRQHEKNWMPMVVGDLLFFIYSNDPVRIINDSGELITTRPASIASDSFRGGGAVIPFDDGWLAVIHESHNMFSGKRRYMHRFVWYDQYGNLQKYSEAFYIKELGIEFVAGLQLYNFGNRAKKNVDLIDTTTENAFALFERSAGFYIDGVAVEQGFRVIFNADTDPLVRGKVFNVSFVTTDGKQVVDLEEAEDGEPALNEVVVSTRGNQYASSNWWYDGASWIYGQQKTSMNQSPLFDL